MSFFARQKLISVTFGGKPGASGTPVFSNAKGIGSTVTISGLRMSAKIVKAGGVSMAELDLRIYGMTLSLMNQVTTFRLAPAGLGSSQKTVTVSAGDDPSSLFTVFIGDVIDAYSDLSNAPDAVFRVSAAAGADASARTLPGTSIRGSAAVADTMKTLADQMGLAFEDNGVDTRILNTHLYGSGRDQMRMLKEAANINATIDDGVLAIWPLAGSRNRPAAIVSPETGMIGYPAYDPQGILVRTLFNPQLHHGAPIVVHNALDENGTSVLPAAESNFHNSFVIGNLSHDLEALTPGGRWETSILATRAGVGLV